MKKQRVSIIFISPNEKVLLIKRTKRNREYWVFPGGGVELGESLESAARREAYEETSFELETTYPTFSVLNQGRREHFYITKTIEFIPLLASCSPELRSQNKLNRYELSWVKLESVSSLNLFPDEAKNILLSFVAEDRI